MGFILIEALWFIIPAYAANGFPVLAKGKQPLDFGRFYKENRILGDGKTFEGTTIGILAGFFFGTIQVLYQYEVPTEWDLNLTTMTFPMIALMVFGAIAGDIISSFFKRRCDIKRGESVFLLDQLNFLVASLFFTSFVFLPSIEIILILLIITPIFHRLMNIFAYKIKFKQNPW